MQALAKEATMEQSKPPKNRDIKTMKRDEIMKLFEWLDFVDPQGHSLVHCQDFIDLVERATSA